MGKYKLFYLSKLLIKNKLFKRWLIELLDSDETDDFEEIIAVEKKEELLNTQDGTIISTEDLQVNEKFNSYGDLEKRIKFFVNL